MIAEKEHLKKIRGARLYQPFSIKLQLTRIKIRQFYEQMNGNVYVAFSGGLDSTVLLHIVRDLYPDVVAVYCNTGNEYPENRMFVKTVSNVIWIKPTKPFHTIIKEYGYPVISKEQSAYISEVRRIISKYPKNLTLREILNIEKRSFVETKSKKRCLLQTRLMGRKDARRNGRILKKYQHLLIRPYKFKISDKCCFFLKKQPVRSFEETTNKYPFLGIRAFESTMRKTSYLKKGCNIYNSVRPKSMPLSFWSHKDILRYIAKYNISYSKLYNMGYDRSGCMFCGFLAGDKSKNNKFQLMAKTHPVQYDYCLDVLGMDKVLDALKIPYM